MVQRHRRRTRSAAARARFYIGRAAGRDGDHDDHPRRDDAVDERRRQGDRLGDADYRFEQRPAHGDGHDGAGRDADRPGAAAGRVIGLASGVGSVPMLLPGPIGNEGLQLDGPSFCPPDPNDLTPDNACEQISAVVPGPSRGPRVTDDGPLTDMITMVAADSAFDQVPLTSFAANGLSVTVALPAPAPPPPVPVGRSTSGSTSPTEESTTSRPATSSC